MHHDNSDLDYGGYSEATPITKTVWQSVFAIAMTLGLGVGASSLIRVHSVASEAGFFVWMVVTIGSSFRSAYYVAKAMSGTTCGRV